MIYHVRRLAGRDIGSIAYVEASSEADALKKLDYERERIGYPKETYVEVAPATEGMFRLHHGWRRYKRVPIEPTPPPTEWKRVP